MRKLIYIFFLIYFANAIFAKQLENKHIVITRALDEKNVIDNLNNRSKISIVCTKSDYQANSLYEFLNSDPQMRYLFEVYSKTEDISINKQLNDLKLKLTNQGLPKSYVNKIIEETRPTLKKKIYIQLSNGKYSFHDTDGFTLKRPFLKVFNIKTEKIPEGTSKITLSISGPRLQSFYQNNNPTELKNLIAHETGHAIMHNLYGDKFPYVEPEQHWGSKVTNEKLAFVEGWAEFCAAYFTNDPTLHVKGDIEKNPFKVSENGTIKSVNGMLATEGVVAALFWDLCKNDKANFDRILKLMEQYKPQNTYEFISIYNRYVQTNLNVALKDNFNLKSNNPYYELTVKSRGSHYAKINIKNTSKIQVANITSNFNDYKKKTINKKVVKAVIKNSKKDKELAYKQVMTLYRIYKKTQKPEDFKKYRKAQLEYMKQFK